jgi:hypothetical protein
VAAPDLILIGIHGMACCTDRLMYGCHGRASQHTDAALAVAKARGEARLSLSGRW